MSKSKFSEEYQKLEEIVSWFEADKVDIDQAMEKFDEGMKLVESLQKKLESTESKIEKLKIKFQ